MGAEKLKEEIQELMERSDESTLKKVKTLMEDELPRKIDPLMTQVLRKAQNEVRKGKYFTDKEVFTDDEKWLNEK